MMWWLLAVPAALVLDALLDEDRRATWAKRWTEWGEAHRLEPSGYRPLRSVNPRAIRPPRGASAVQRPHIARRNGGSGLRSGGKIGSGSRHH